MYRTVVIPKAEHEATVTARIFWVVLDDLTICEYSSHLCRADHPIRPQHLSKGMR